ncbi:hypothetical protein IC575_015046 [Cucumis melo]
MSTILKHIGLQRKGDEGDHKVSEGLEDEHIEVKKKGDEDVLEKKVDIGLEEPIDVVDDEGHRDRTISHSMTTRSARRRKRASHLDALFLFIRLKIKAAGIPSSQNFTTVDTIFMVCNRLVTLSHFSFEVALYKECIKENRPLDWDEEYRLVDYVVGSKVDFQDPWASVDYVYSPFNVHGNHWVLLCLDLVSCQVKVWDSLLTQDYAHSTVGAKVVR